MEALHEHTGTLHALATGTGFLSPALLDLRAWCGHYLTEPADLPRAIDLHQQVQAEREQLLGAEHPECIDDPVDVICRHQGTKPHLDST
jgi:hypothetical protein